MDKWANPVRMSTEVRGTNQLYLTNECLTKTIPRIGDLCSLTMGVANADFLIAELFTGYAEVVMSGPIVRTGTTPKFWENWDQAFGGGDDDKKSDGGKKSGGKKKASAGKKAKAAKKKSPKKKKSKK